MSDARASVGVLVAGGALVAAAAAWPSGSFGGIVEMAIPLVIGLAAAAVIGFSGVRHGALPVRRVARLTMVAGTGIALGCAIAFVEAEPGSTARVATGVAAVLGIAVGWLGSALYRDRSLAAIAEEARIVTFGIALGYGGIVLAAVLGSLHTLAGLEPAPVVDFALSQAGVGVGLVLAVIVFVAWTGRGRSYLDVRRPTRRETGYMIVGTLGVVAIAMGLQLVLDALGVPFEAHSVEQRAREEGAALLLVAIAGSFLVQGLGEELLFRNGVQKLLTERFVGPVAIVVTSLIFTSIHITAYGGAGGSLVVVFALSLVLGAVYDRTENVLVTIVMHGGYNALMWLLIYVRLA